MRTKVELTMSTTDLLLLMSEGNPGAITVLMQLVVQDPLLMLTLNDMNIRGSQIWVGYKDVCGEDLELFKQKVLDRDSAMVDAINAECYHPTIDDPAYQHVAKERGASWEHE